MSESLEYRKCPCLHCGQHIEFHPSATGDTIKCPQCGQQTMLHQPLERATGPLQTPPPKALACGRIRLSPATGIAALIILCFLVAAFFGFETWQARNTTRTALAAELRLLNADLKTGINQSDFLRQVARVRAAYDGAKSNLKHSQNERFAEIELDMAACAVFWGDEMEPSRMDIAARDGSNQSL